MTLRWVGGTDLHPPVKRPGPNGSGDPIFAAINSCRKAKLRYDKAYARVDQLYRIGTKRCGAGDAREVFVAERIGGGPDAYTDAMADDLGHAYEVFAETVPTTRTGLFAMLAFVLEISASDPGVFDDMPILPTVVAAAEALMPKR